MSTENDSLMRNIVTRESFSSRAGAASIAAVLVIVVCLYALLETTLKAIGQPAWLADPQKILTHLAALPQGVSPTLLGAGGAVIAFLGLLFLGQSVFPGRRARHVIANDRTGVVIDDEVIASALARRARLAAGVSQAQVLVTVSRAQVLVNVRPTSGVPVREETIAAAVQEELNNMAPQPMPTVRVNLASTGVIGA
ncbi:DUF6286 domain-containing protein [Pseudarthrobacter sp. J1738]|uniref:DUF6286 domain-containing protein n=1 Tax=unclassified Pseudarthrobacter TaxID=2647000 RepID=UPI003D26A7E6